MVRDYLVNLEKNLMVGGGRWVADFNASFWDYSLGDLVFDMFVRASVRPKGFALSRRQAWLTIPDYRVACFVYSKDPQLKHLYGVLTSVSAFLRESEFAWAWLVICHEGPFSRKARAMVEHNSNSEIGLALVDVSSQEITTASSYLARRMRSLLACFN